MKFYSKIVSKPNPIFEEIRDGFKVVKRTKICEFIDGILETDDKEVIAKLQKRPDLFRTNRPWTPMPNWRITDKGRELLAEGERLNIDCRHIRECYLKQRIQEILHPIKKNIPEAPVENEKKVVNSYPSRPKVDYRAMIKLAKEAGIKGHGVKKEILRKTLKEKGVI